MKPLLLAILIAFGLPVKLDAQEPVPSFPAAERLPSIQLPAELDRVLREYERAWQARDAAGLAALFTEEGMVLANGRSPVRGRAAVEQAYTGVGGPLSLRALAYTRADSLAHIIGAYSMREGQPDVGKFVLVLHRDATGAWRIMADMENINQMSRHEPDQQIAARNEEILKLRNEIERIRKVLLPQLP